MKKLTVIAATLACTGLTCAANDGIQYEPTGSYLYAEKGGQSLFLDYYAPTGDTLYNGHRRPTVLFMFGGGFKEGERNEKEYVAYFKRLCEAGYGVISIDYRLALKDAKVGTGLSNFNTFNNAVHIAVEDLYSATVFVIENENELGVDSKNLVLAGSSAGAISVLQGAWEADWRSPCAKVLPDGFRYAAVISFAGAIFSNQGKLDYTPDYCPTLLFHGIDDKVVEYNQIRFMRIGMFGSNKIEERLTKFNLPHRIYRFEGLGHEIAAAFLQTFSQQLDFLEKVVMLGKDVRIDAVVSDPTIKKWNLKSSKDLYK